MKDATEQALLAAIRDNPEADDPRLMYADFLDEREGSTSDDATRARFIRTQIRVSVLERDGHVAWPFGGERTDRECRTAFSRDGCHGCHELIEMHGWSKRLLKENRLTWLTEVGDFAGLTKTEPFSHSNSDLHTDDDVNDTVHIYPVKWHRGFISRVDGSYVRHLVTEHREACGCCIGGIETVRFGHGPKDRGTRRCPRCAGTGHKATIVPTPLLQEWVRRLPGLERVALRCRRPERFQTRVRWVRAAGMIGWGYNSGAYTLPSAVFDALEDAGDGVRTNSAGEPVPTAIYPSTAMAIDAAERAAVTFAKGWAKSRNAQGSS